MSAHDFRSGAAYVLPASTRCVRARPSHFRKEVDHCLDRDHVDLQEVTPLESCDAGAIVYVEWADTRWLKVRVLPRA